MVIVCDATFYGKKKDKLGTLVFKDILSKEVLIWKHVQSELTKDYKQLLQRLLDIGYEVKAIIIDGKRGLYKAFKDYPIQMCHFHQKKVIQRYITMHPRLEAGKDLQKIMYNLTSTTQTIFTKKLNEWYEKYKDFLAEKTINPDTMKESFTHQKLVSAYRSLKTNLPYLFTYKNEKNIKINNTTNAIDGGVFSPMKKLLKIHNGFTKSLKLKMVDDYLVSYKKKWLFRSPNFSLSRIIEYIDVGNATYLYEDDTYNRIKSRILSSASNEKNILNINSRFRQHALKEVTKIGVNRYTHRGGWRPQFQSDMKRKYAVHPGRLK